MSIAKIPRSLPFADWDEWLNLARLVKSPEGYDIDTVSLQEFLQIVALWRLRGRVPHAVESTAHLIEILAADKCSNVKFSNIGIVDSAHYGSVGDRRSDQELRMLFSLALIRGVNGLVDAVQQGQFAGLSIMTVAERIGLPSWIAEIRHDATHNQLPPLTVLRSAARQLLRWYFDRYWGLQASLLNSMTLCCIPTALTSQSNARNVEQQEQQQQQKLTFKSVLASNSVTFLVEFFLPVFLSATVHSVNHSGGGNSSSGKEMSIERHLARQRNAWEPFLSKAFAALPLFMFPMLSQLLSAAGNVLLQAFNDDEKHTGANESNGNRVDMMDQQLINAQSQLQVVDHWASKVLHQISKLRTPAAVGVGHYGAAPTTAANNAAALAAIGDPSCSSAGTATMQSEQERAAAYLIAVHSPMVQSALHQLQYSHGQLHLYRLKYQLQNKSAAADAAIANAVATLVSKVRSHFPQISAYDNSLDIYFHPLRSTSDDASAGAPRSELLNEDLGLCYDAIEDNDAFNVDADAFDPYSSPSPAAATVVTADHTIAGPEIESSKATAAAAPSNPLDELEQWLNGLTSAKAAAAGASSVASASSSGERVDDNGAPAVHNIENGRSKRSADASVVPTTADSCSDGGRIRPVKRVKFETDDAVATESLPSATIRAPVPALAMNTSTGLDGCGAVDRIVCCAAYPAWPIGCLPGTYSTGQLLQIQLVEDDFPNNT